MGWKEDNELSLKKQQEWFESRSQEEKTALRVVEDFNDGDSTE